ncbi:MAG TPA: sugar transferase [Verrucomicrobiota bacterium]|nr:sugar transferase [Verrucomicrobiota bacterium]HNT13991.1 sugar transferase [Verrucomicrobiota bacterium]
MLRRDRQMRMQISQLLDACIFAASFWLAYEIRASDFVTITLGQPPIAPFEVFFWHYLVLIPVSPLVLESQGFYDRSWMTARKTLTWALFKGCLFISLGLTLALFFSRLLIARGVPIGFGVIAFCLVLLKEELMSLAAQSRFGQSQFRRHFLLLGTGSETERIRHEIQQRPESGVEIIAELDLNQLQPEELVNLLHERAINGVILSSRHSLFDRAEMVVHACELEGVEVWLVADFFKTRISTTTMDDFYGRPMLVFRSTPEVSWQGKIKEAIDFVGALLLLSLLFIPLVVVALFIKLTSSGPVFFKQQRSGLNGAPFTIYKFRTMVTNAEQIKHELAAMNEMTGPVFKLTKDPRITAIGRWLRKFSIDEFPQLFNVLRGEMSLVGPRPLPVDETKRIHDMAHRRRLSVKPGLTCLWQVSGRNEIKKFEDWVRLDLEYIDNWSLWLDLKILLRTIPAVFQGAGAK